MSAHRPFWGLLKRRDDLSARASELYGRLVALARQPAFYAAHGVPDSPEGRLEVLMVHVVLALRRLAREGEAAAPLARALSETFVTDMDDCLREMGVGDLTVAKKVKKAAAALFDRSRDYGKALDAGDRTELARLIEVHVLDGGKALAKAQHIGAYVLALERALAAARLETMIDGTAKLPEITY